MNIQPHIILNGKDSRSIQGLLISRLAPISKPPVRTQIEEIDGRSGDIVTPLGYGAYDKTVSIGLTYRYDIDDIIEFFNSSGEVIFSNEPDKVYQYAIYDQIDFEKLIKFKTAEVVLHVQPYKLSSIEKPQTFTVLSSPATINIYNSGNIYSRPIISITATGDVAVSLNGSEILNIDFGETEQTIIIDCEQMNAYNSNKTLLNRLVTGNYDNIKLIKGSNEISLTGSVSSVTINKYSRWI